jgi:alpha-tubulin suppressor-like RCC1 family protein
MTYVRTKVSSGAWRLSRLGAVLVLMGGAGCIDDTTAPGGNASGGGGLLLAAAQPGLYQQATTETVTYVSLSPGKAPGGVTATATDLANGVSVTAPVEDGGFDPVPLRAGIGDSVEVVIRDAAGIAAAMFGTRVPERRPPLVVRTVPPTGRPDVPLNLVIQVVFSEPIDTGTLAPRSLQLVRNGAVVAGSRRFADAAHVVAAFTPTDPLASQASYALVVTTDIRDQAGDALEAPVTVSFTTGSSQTGAVNAVAVTPVRASVSVGSTLSLTADVRDATGNPIDSTVTWASLNPSVATVSANGVVTGVSPGSADIAATSGGARAVATVAVQGTLNFVSVVAGPDHACGVTRTGAAFCWGANSSGAGGDGIEEDSLRPESLLWPTPVVGNLAFAANGLALGDSYTCGLTTDGTAYCWGYDWWGNLGVAPNPNHHMRPTPQAVSGGIRFMSLSTGRVHTCGLAVGGQAYCWGLNKSGALGDTTLAVPPDTGDGAQGDMSAYVHTTPVAVDGGITFASIGVSAGGYAATCGLSTNGVVYCWGSSDGGLLGDGSSQQSSHADPRPVAGGLTFVSLGVGQYHACASTADGTVYCWGIVEVAMGTSTFLATPTPVQFAEPFTAVAAGSEHTCALTADGRAYCWGGNDAGALGDGTATTRANPAPVLGGLAFGSISASGLGSWGVTCGLTTDSIAYCWGFGAYGEGDGTSRYGYGLPTKVANQP